MYIRHGSVRIDPKSKSISATLLKKILENCEDGDITEKQVYDIFKHLESLQRASARSLAGWKRRFEAMNGTRNLAVMVAKTA